MLRYIFFIIVVTYSITSNGQGAIKKQRRLSDKVFFGGGIGLQFGTVTAIEVLPMVGYKPVDDLYLGLKGKYEYYKHSSYPSGTSIYGGSAFGMYTMFKALLAYAEYEVLSLESEYFNYYQSNGDRFLLHSPLLGGGFIQSLGGRSKIMLLVLWNFDNTYSTYYSNPTVRLSFLF